MKTYNINNIRRACNLFNDVSNPAKLRTDFEHRICRKAQKKLENYIAKNFTYNVHYKEFTNGMLIAL